MYDVNMPYKSLLPRYPVYICVTIFGEEILATKHDKLVHINDFLPFLQKQTTGNWELLIFEKIKLLHYVTFICYFTYNSRGAWNTLYAMLLSNINEISP